MIILNITLFDLIFFSCIIFVICFLLVRFILNLFEKLFLNYIYYSNIGGQCAILHKRASDFYTCTRIKKIQVTKKLYDYLQDDECFNAQAVGQPEFLGNPIEINDKLKFRLKQFKIIYK